jgi:ubiquinone/menaquinone biosynthesis C-methylase UbiE
LRIFHQYGYECHGIEISRDNLHNALEYAEKNTMNLVILEGDMRELPYEDSSFSFVFTHHSVFHMRKTEIRRAVDEMRRVLTPEGLLFINLPTMEREDRMHGKKVGKGEYESKHGNEVVIHSYFEDEEADFYFQAMKYVQKRKYTIFKSEGWGEGISMLEYIMRKS